MKNKLLISLIGFALLLGAVVVFGSTGSSATKEEDPLTTVTLLDVSQYLDKYDSIDTTGVVNPSEEVNLKSEINGKLIALPYEVGDYVDMGTVIAKFDDRNLELQAKQAEVNLESEQIQLEKLNADPTDLDVKNIKLQIESAESVYDELLSQYETTEAKNSDSLFNIYENIINSLKVGVEVAKNNLLLLADMQYEYTYDNQQTWHEISLIKADILLKLFDEDAYNTKNWASFAISALDEGLYGEVKDFSWSVDDTSADSITEDYETIETNLEDVIDCLEETGQAISLAISDSNITSDDVATLQAAYAEISNEISILTNLQQSIQTQKQTNTTNLQTIEIQLINAEASIDTAKTAFENLYEGPTEEDIELQKMRIESAQINLDSINLQLEKSTVASPISGVISETYVIENDYINVGQNLISIVNVNGLEIESYISVDDKSLLEEGSTVVINGEYYGTIVAIAPNVNLQTGKIEIRIVPQEGEENMTIGEVVDVEIIPNSVEENGIYLLPFTAVRVTSSGSFVFSVVNEEVIKHPVETGEVIGDKVEILSGLEADLNIIEDVSKVNEGNKVSVIEN